MEAGTLAISHLYALHLEGQFSNDDVQECNAMHIFEEPFKIHACANTYQTIGTGRESHAIAEPHSMPTVTQLQVLHHTRHKRIDT